jgi:hypothetical protein
VHEPWKTAASGTVQYGQRYLSKEFATLRLTLSAIAPKTNAGAQRERNRIMRSFGNKLLAAGVAGALLLGAASPSLALPVASSTKVVSEAAPAATTNVRWHGRHHGRWIGPAVGLGILGLGVAAAANRGYYDGYYGPGYYGYDPYYGGCYRDRWGRVFCR